MSETEGASERTSNQKWPTDSEQASLIKCIFVTRREQLAPTCAQERATPRGSLNLSLSSGEFYTVGSLTQTRQASHSSAVATSVYAYDVGSREPESTLFASAYEYLYHLL